MRDNLRPRYSSHHHDLVPGSRLPRPAKSRFCRSMDCPVPLYFRFYAARQSQMSAATFRPSSTALPRSGGSGSRRWRAAPAPCLPALRRARAAPGARRRGRGCPRPRRAPVAGHGVLQVDGVAVRAEEAPAGVERDLEVEAVRVELLARDADADDEVLACRLAHRGQGLPEESQAALRRAAVGVASDVGPGAQELRVQVPCPPGSRRRRILLRACGARRHVAQARHASRAWLSAPATSMQRPGDTIASWPRLLPFSSGAPFLVARWRPGERIDAVLSWSGRPLPCLRNPSPAVPCAASCAVRDA